MGSQTTHKPNGLLGPASWASLALAAVIGAFAAWQAGSQRAGYSAASIVPIPEALEQAASAASAAGNELAAVVVAAPAPIEVRVYTEGELRRGETLAAALDRQDVSPALVHEIATSLRPVFDFRYSRAGDRYRLAQDAEGRITDFDYRRSEWERFTLRRAGDALLPERVAPEVEVERGRVAGVITSPSRRSARAASSRTTSPRSSRGTSTFRARSGPATSSTSSTSAAT
jgi:hypothetical protein